MSFSPISLGVLLVEADMIFLTDLKNESHRNNLFQNVELILALLLKKHINQSGFVYMNPS